MQMLTTEVFASIVTGMPTERKAETLAFRVTTRVYTFTKELAETERREMSEVARAIYERGLAAFQRDGLLFEPVKPQSQDQASKKLSSTSKTRTG